jgi:hypothetical protein
MSEPVPAPDEPASRDESLERDALADDDLFAGDPSLAEYEERLAAQRVAAINAGRRKAGLAGAAMAGAMFALSDVIEGPPKEDSPVTVEASSKPHDLEKEGFGATIGDVDVEAPPLERVDPVTNRKSRR